MFLMSELVTFFSGCVIIINYIFKMLNKDKDGGCV
jgi:hypothetical protein